MPRRVKLTHTETIEVVVLVLQNEQNDVLLTQRRKDVHLANYWEFPGGKIEIGETPDEALCREISEELAYQPQNPQLLQYIDYDYDAFSVRLHVYSERAEQPKVTGNENQAWQWCPLDRLKQMQLPPANQAIVNTILNKY